MPALPMILFMMAFSPLCLSKRSGIFKKVTVEVQDIHPRLPQLLQSFLWKSSVEGHKVRVEYLKTFPDVLAGVVGPRCVNRVVLETKF